jgi:hypothetical protein
MPSVNLKPLRKVECAYYDSPGEFAEFGLNHEL